MPIPQPMAIMSLWEYFDEWAEDESVDVGSVDVLVVEGLGTCPMWGRG
jgi:hypothetical protein